MDSTIIGVTWFWIGFLTAFGLVLSDRRFR